MSGTVTIDETTGIPSGTGVAFALYTEIESEQTSANPLPDPNTPDADWEDGPEAWHQLMFPLVVKIRKAWAREARAHAAVLASGGGKALTGDTALSTALTNVGLPVDVESGKTYEITWNLITTCSGTGGLKIALGGTATGTVDGFAFGPAASLAAFTSVETTSIGGAAAGVFGSAAAAAKRWIRYTVVVTASADGTIDAALATVTSPQTGAVKALSSVSYREVST